MLSDVGSASLPVICFGSFDLDLWFCLKNASVRRRLRGTSIGKIRFPNHLKEPLCCRLGVRVFQVIVVCCLIEHNMHVVFIYFPTSKIPIP